MHYAYQLSKKYLSRNIDKRFDAFQDSCVSRSEQFQLYLTAYRRSFQPTTLICDSMPLINLCTTRGWRISPQKYLSSSITGRIYARPVNVDPSQAVQIEQHTLLRILGSSCRYAHDTPSQLHGAFFQTLPSSRFHQLVSETTVNKKYIHPIYSIILREFANNV